MKHLLHVGSEIMYLQAIFVGHNGVFGGSCITAENNTILIHYTSDGSTCLNCFWSSKALFDQGIVPVYAK